MKFAPVAIIGQGCVLPGAFTIDELWEGVLSQRDFLASATEDDWRLSNKTMQAWSGAEQWSTRGGYIRGFDSIFDPTGFLVQPEELLTLDPSVHWLLQAARTAIQSAGLSPVDMATRHAGAIIGNLSLPTRLLSKLSEFVWLEEWETSLQTPGLRELAVGEMPDPRNRFISGFPTHLLAQALGLQAGSYAIDAACASSLYAIKLACDWLHQGRADVMLAGSVNGADPLFLHTGFRALTASSRTGQSRPFHAEADGLVPSEGAGVVVLKRLQDAQSAGDPIVGVIRGVGLSNDGGKRSFLVPAKDGQVEAMQNAYHMSALRPSDVSFVECHATGTVVGDSTEIASMSEVFGGVDELPIGSLKSNMGHLITTSGIAGLFKVLKAMQEQVRPASRCPDIPLKALTGTPFRLVREAEPWLSNVPRVAAISSFGFGGNNAHLLVEEWNGQTYPEIDEMTEAQRHGTTIAIVGIGVQAGSATNKEQFADWLFRGGSQGQDFPFQAETVTLSKPGLFYPPKDLEVTLPQQLMMLKAGREALSQVNTIDCGEIGVYTGMQCDAEIPRYIAAIRLLDWVDIWSSRRPGFAATLPPLGQANQRHPTVAGALESATVVGLLPNIVANRLNHFFRCTGPSFSVSSEELSGLDALSIGADSLRSGEIDMAMVGAVDLCCEPVQAWAASQLRIPYLPSDAAVVLVLKRLEDAQRAGDTVYAVLSDEPVSGKTMLHFGDGPGDLDLRQTFGHAHAASALLQVAAAALCCFHRVQPHQLHGASMHPWLCFDERGPSIQVSVKSFTQFKSTVWVSAAPDSFGASIRMDSPLYLYMYSGASTSHVLDHLRVNELSAHGRAKLVIVAASEQEFEVKRRQAETFLQQTGAATGVVSPADGVYFSSEPIGGEIGFVFTGAASSYVGMGKELLLAFPALTAELASLYDESELVDWIYGSSKQEASPIQRVMGTAYLSQFHARLSAMIGLHPQAAIGLSAGETNALTSLGAWGNPKQLYQDIKQSGVFTRTLGVEFEVLRHQWSAHGQTWTNWRILAPVEQVQSAMATEEFVRLTLINSPTDCIIGGDKDACLRVLQRVGAHRGIPLNFDVVIHCKEFAPVETVWRELHRRPTVPVPGIRFYSSSSYSHYPLTEPACEEALFQMALHPVDFPRLIRAAYEDGVRVFVEHGPRNLCQQWIKEILGEDKHLFVAWDKPGRSSVHQMVHTMAQLLAGGVEFPHQNVIDLLNRAVLHRETTMGSDEAYFYAAHPEPLTASSLLETTSDIPMLPRPPQLPPILMANTSNHDGDYALPSIVSSDAPLPVATVTDDRGHPALLAARLHHQQLVQAHAAYQTHQAQVYQHFQHMAALIRQHLVQVANAPVPVDVLNLGPQLDEPESTVVVDYGQAMESTSAHSWIPADHEDLAVPPKDSVLRMAPSGPAFSRQQLEVLASGKISSVFGHFFEQQDGYSRQVRMPEPPLLLADRVTGLVGEPGSMRTGIIWTETDVQQDAWYLHDGYMPFGLMVESGQADLLLISWLGADFLNHGQRVYRLLGCEMTFHGRLPVAGETLEYEIHVDGHARHGDIRLFFFHYDCYVSGEKRLTMRHGQAGFFTDEELDESKGVIWDPMEEVMDDDFACDPPAVFCEASSFTKDQVIRFSEGDAAACFGPGFEVAATHTRSPRIAPGMLLFLEEVTHFDVNGGPWGRGYLRAETTLTGQEWYFPCHFKGDPAMPGTLMMEGCFQAMAFYLTALGFTLDKDGYRFEPIPEVPYKAVCRGQVTPSSRNLVYEVFVAEVHGGDVPQMFADVLVTVDGLKAFHCRRMGLQLVPDWPLTSHPKWMINHVEPKPVASVGNFEFGYASLLACAWGKPSDAFGEAYAAFDGTRRLPRLPGPPYHFMSRVTHIEGTYGEAIAGTAVEVEYDIPHDAWYFAANGHRTMPYSVLLEAALQPCGWLTAYMGIPLASPVDVSFRNLDGTGTLYREVTPEAGTLSTKVKATTISRMGETVIETFEVECFQANQLVYQLSTVFGHFPKETLLNQAGLPITPDDAEQRLEPSQYEVDLTALPGKFFAGPLRLAKPPLCMLDRLTGWWPGAGRAELGRMRAEKTVNPYDWFFKAHFFQDPVQPGSLGLEAMIQLLQAAMIELGLHQGLSNPRFEPIQLHQPLTWKYRGQVLPQHRLITTEIDLTDIGRDKEGIYAVCEASLWVDDLKIYHAENLGMRVVGDGPPQAAPWITEEIFNPHEEAWIYSHQPTYNVPVMPFMFLVDRMAMAAEGAYPNQVVSKLWDVQIHQWFVCEEPVFTRTIVESSPDDPFTSRVSVRIANPGSGSVGPESRFQTVATGWVSRTAVYPNPEEGSQFGVMNPDPLMHGEPEPEDIYESGHLFHGPEMRVVRDITVGSNGSTAMLDAGMRTAPLGLLHPLLLDGATHAIVGDELERWAPDIDPGQVCFPSRLLSLQIFTETPISGMIRAEVRFQGFYGDNRRFPRFHIFLYQHEKLWAVMDLVEVLFTQGPVASIAPELRRAFLGEGQYVPGFTLAHIDGGITRIQKKDVQSLNWLPGALQKLYRIGMNESHVETWVAIKEHVAHQLKVHPSAIQVSADFTEAWHESTPGTRFAINVEEDHSQVVVWDKEANS